MPKPPPKTVVTGVPENQRALAKAGEIDLEKANEQAASDLIPFIRRETPVDTGTMQGSWDTDKGAFINEVDYAGYVEYGTMFTFGAHAIQKAIDEHEDELLKPFDKETDRAARKAGFDR